MGRRIYVWNAALDAVIRASASNAKKSHGLVMYPWLLQVPKIFGKKVKKQFPEAHNRLN
jgi:hypothetical protein